jgi:hypothetical protein
MPIRLKKALISCLERSHVEANLGSKINIVALTMTALSGQRQTGPRQGFFPPRWSRIGIGRNAILV